MNHSQIRRLVARALVVVPLLMFMALPLRSQDARVVAEWRFDEGAGTVAHDASSMHNDGEIVGALWVPGRFATGLHFDGLSQYVVLPNANSLKLAGMFTMEAWINLDTLEFDPSTYERQATILGNLGPFPYGGGYQLYVASGEGLQLAYRAAGGLSRFTHAVPIPSAHHWYHVAAVGGRVASDADSLTVVKLYLDGVLKDSVAYSESIQYDETPYFYIGTNMDGRAVGKIGVREFPGVMDEIRISDVARDPSQFGARELTASPSTLDFGLVEVGKSASLDLAIFNAAFYESVHVDSLTFSNPRFSSAFSGVDLGPMASITIPVTYTPAAAQPDSGVLTIYAADLAPYNVPLLGRGYALGNAPVIHAIKDIPGDQGRQVRVSWYPSTYDAPGESLRVAQYSLWRRVDGPASSAMKAAASIAGTAVQARTMSIDGELWDFIVDVPAVNFEEYAYVAPTLRNASPFGISWSVFRVAAHTATGEFFFSAADSGFSLDNVYPFPPMSLQASVMSGRVLLTWNASASGDVREYRIYRSTSSNLVASANSRIASSANLGYLDTTLLPDSTYYYILTAVDSSWNESAPTAAVGGVRIVDVDGHGDGLPGQYDLQQNFPNPFNPSTEIVYDLPKASSVRLTVLNVLGQEMAVIAHEVQSAGYYRYAWTPSMSSGIYFYRLEATNIADPSERFVQVRKMLLLK